MSAGGRVFTALDYALLGLYFLILTAIGAKFYRRSSRASEFFVGGRSMAWLPVAISVIASDTSAITLLGNPGYAYVDDIKLILYILAYTVAAWLVIVIFLPFYCRLNFYTAYEYLEGRFDVRVRCIASGLFLLIRGAHVSIAMYAPAIVLTLVSRMPLPGSILLMGIIATLYTTMGGIRAVIWTDVMQFCIVLAGVVFTFFLTIKRVHGGIPAILQIGSQYGKWQLWDFSLNLTSSTTFWAMFLGGIVLALATVGTDQAVLQRYFTAKSAQECSRSLKAYSIILIPYNLALVLMGVFLFAFYHQHPDLAKGMPSADSVLAYFAVHQLPRLLATLLMASIFAASMGVMSAGINSLSTCSVVDFYRRIWKREASDAEFVRAGRTFTVLWGAFTTVGALYAGRLGRLALAFGKIQGFVGGVMLGIFLLGIFSRRTNALGAIGGSAVGMACVCYLAFGTGISFFWYGSIGCLVTIAAGYAISSIGTKPVGVPDYLFFGGARPK
jgi:sodium-coupled monocarboxylate transporter 8/12